ncbi:MAG: choice-of-anchor Q domain-containing protein [candidate division FCPU426 bacterium]
MKKTFRGWRFGLGLALAAAGSAAAAQAAVYYVASGNSLAADANPGTQSLPWLTLQHAADTVSAGDEVVVLPGDYARPTLRRGGAAGAPIIFRGQNPPDRSLMNPDAVLDPASPVPVPGNPAANAVVHGVSIRANFIHVRNLEVTAITGRGGISVQDCQDVEISGNFIHDLNPGLYDYGGVRGENHRTYLVRVLNNVLYHVQGTGIGLMGQGWLVEGNEVSHGTDIRTDTGEDTGGDVDAVRFFGGNHVIRGNYLHHYLNTECAGSPHMDAFQTFSVYPDSQFAYNIVVEGNRCEYFGQMFMCEDQAEQSGGENSVHDITFRNNLFRGARAYSIIISDYTDHFSFINNVVSESWYGPLSVSDHGHHITVLNNIFYRNGQSAWSTAQGRNGGAQLNDPTCIEGSLWDYNLYYPDFTWPLKNPDFDRHSRFGPDPQFADAAASDFHLTAGSPAVDAGSPWGNFNYDLEGHFRPHGPAWDLGAYEYNSHYAPPPADIALIPVMTYPNPGRDRVHFRFDPRTPAAVSVDIFNPAGERVGKLAGFVDPDWRNLDCDARGWPAGVYLYRVIQNGKPGATGKFALRP